MANNQDIIAIYSRKSRFTGKGESIGNQVELCRAYICTAFGEAHAAGAAVFEDEGFSGGNLNRPDFKRMMKAAREHRFRAVVVYRLDRISRNISDFSALIQELGRLGIDFVSIRESFDTSSPMGRAMMYIASVFSQLERETIAERIRDNMHELAKTGRWLGGTTPTGYTSEAVKTTDADGRNRRACRLKLIPREADIVRTIYQLYRETDSLTGTEAELLRRGIKTKTGHDFTRFSIKNILQNPVYLIADRDAYHYFLDRQADLFSGLEEFDGVRGILAYNRTDQEKGRATVFLPISQWIVAVGQHPGIVPSRIWIAVQQSLERNRSKTCRKPRSNEALLTGLLWCRCGSRMYPKLSGRVTAEEQPAFAYVCRKKQHSKRSLCGLRNAGGNALDAAVLEQIKALQVNGRRFLARLEQGEPFLFNSRQKEETELEELRRRQEETERKITALVDSLADFGGSSAAAHVKQRIEELHSQEAGLHSRIRQLEELASCTTLSEAEFFHARQLLLSFSESIDRMSVEQKRSALRMLVRKVVWDGQQAHVVLFGASALCEPDAAPLSGPENPEAPDNGQKALPAAPAKTHRGEDSK